jgi:folate-binding protein YgfZ
MSWHDFLIERRYVFEEVHGARRLVHTPARRPACVDLSHHALLAFDGADARTFLQGYLTCDVNALTPSRSLPTALCDLKGRVVADGVVMQIAQTPTLSLHGSLASVVEEFLRKYLAFSRTRLRVLDGSWVTLGLLDCADAAMPSATPFETTSFRDGVSIRVPGEPARWLLALPEPTARDVWLGYEAEGLVGDDESWRRADIEAGWARVTAATSGQFLPQMLGLTDLGGVSFEKGCYLGQEIVARTHHLGKVKRGLFRATWHGASTPVPGLTLEAAFPGTATVISAAMTSPGRGEALVVATATGRASAQGVTFDIR